MIGGRVEGSEVSVVSSSSGRGIFSGYVGAIPADESARGAFVPINPPSSDSRTSDSSSRLEKLQKAQHHPWYEASAYS